MTKMPPILCVDDEQDIVESIELALGTQYEVHTASSVAEAKKRIEAERFAVVVTDLNFHGQSDDGLSLIDWLKDRGDATPIIVLSGDQDTRRVISAQRRIEDDFVVKPFELSDLVCAIERARTRAAKAHGETPQRRLHEVLTRDARVQNALTQIKKVILSDLDLPICILGESGTGKEELAKYAASVRGGPFVAVNMGAISKELAESELFGHVRGSFSGAHSDRKGKFQDAHRGVIFLDEVGDCPVDLQVKLFRVLQEREVTPVGSSTPIKVDVKVVCATNQNLEELCKRGLFREELLRRIEGMTIVNPPLRERRGDIAVLVGKFLQEKSPKYRPASITPEALAALERYDWPGNVRELVSVIEQALLNADFREIGIRHLPPKVLGLGVAIIAPTHQAEQNQNLNFDARMRAEEIRVFDEALKTANGSRAEAQRLLGLSKTTFHRKFYELGLGQKGYS
ncbi:MAG: sigma-54-dependent Fis family transcriptional regulator [Bdellovibrionales bacterium]|nr:sigma-54-dependent Fis family transcriptional regulator [Bdellovibrionales bacterium]